MTIKEIAEQTGMSRANIRYYETEGLLTPARQDNGYRTYTEEDANTLLRIKLLRALDIPLEEIRQVQDGAIQLPDALDRHLQVLAQRQEATERMRIVTAQMCSDAAEFSSLDADRYLLALDAAAEQALRKDVEPRLNLPWRRFWARNLDYGIYHTLLTVIPSPFSGSELAISLLTLVFMLLLEPALLHLFGTTPGKAIFGIRVTDPDGGRLTYGAALDRTWVVLWEGEAMRLPFLNLYFNYKSLTAAENSQLLPWERESELTFRDDRMWRYGLHIAVGILLGTLEFLILANGG